MNANHGGQGNPTAIHDVSADEAWAWCLAIHEQITQFKKAEEEELELELRLEEVRQRKRTLQESAVKCLAAKAGP